MKLCRGALLLPMCLLVLFNISFVQGHEGAVNEIEEEGYWAWWGYSHQQFINITVQAEVSKGWISFGIGRKSGGPVDSLLGYSFNNATHALDLWNFTVTNSIVSYAEDSKVNGTYDILSYTVLAKESPITEFRFSRRLDTLDANADNKIAPGDELVIHWAYGNVSSIGLIEKAINAGMAHVDFYAGCDESDDLQQLKKHGILMYLCVGLLIPIAMMLSRYLKHHFAKWFYAHVGLFLVSMVLMFAAGILAFQAHDWAIVWSWHTSFAYLFIISFLSQVIIGFNAHFKFDPSRYQPPFWPDKVHWYVGRATGVLGVITVFFGVNSLGVPEGWALYVFWLLVLAVSIAALEKIIGQTHESLKGAHVIEDEDDLTDFESGKVRKAPSVNKYVAVIIIMLAVTVIPMLWMIGSVGEEGGTMMVLDACPL